MNKARLANLRECFSRIGAEVCLVSGLPNLRYFSGFSGDDTFLLVTMSTQFIVTDSRYTEQAKAEAPLFEIIEQKEGLLGAVAGTLKKIGAVKIAFEGKNLCWNDCAKLKELYPNGEFLSVQLDSLRIIKDADEIAAIRTACDIADRAFADILRFLRPGLREYEVAAELEHRMRLYGAERSAFEIIVASGKRGSLPHGRASDKLLNAGDFVTMDFGAVYNGYHSDMTRTICLGKAATRQKEIYDAVLAAQKLAFVAIRPGKSGKEVDAVARDYLAKYGLAKHFGHGLGHSLGLTIHEEPRLSPRSQLKALAPGMLVTDEPGVYIADWGGVRIEDTVLVTADGAEALTRSAKELIEI